jgi:hypothetical protein
MSQFYVSSSGGGGGGAIDTINNEPPIANNFNITANNTTSALGITSAAGGSTLTVQYDGTTIGVNGSNQLTVIGGGGGTVDSVVAGANISVNSGDPANPIVSVQNSPTFTGTVSTTNNILDDGSGNMSVADTLTVNTTNFSSFKAFSVLDVSNIPALNVDSSTDAVTTLNNTLDDGSGNLSTTGNVQIGGLGGAGQTLSMPTSTYSTFDPNIVSSNTGLGGNSLLTINSDSITCNLDSAEDGQFQILNSGSHAAFGVSAQNGGGFGIDAVSYNASYYMMDLFVYGSEELGFPYYFSVYNVSGTPGTVTTLNNTLDDSTGNATFIAQTTMHQIVLTDGQGTSGQFLTSQGTGMPNIWTSGGEGGGIVDSVVAGANITVNATDPANPVVSVSNSPTFTGTVGTTNNVLDDGSGNLTTSGNITIGSLAGAGQTLYMPTDTYNTYDPNIVSSNTGVGGYSIMTFDADNFVFNMDPSQSFVVNGAESNVAIIDASGNLTIQGSLDVYGSDSIFNINKASTNFAFNVWSNTVVGDFALRINTNTYNNISVGQDLTVDGIPPDYEVYFHVIGNSANGTPGEIDTMYNQLDDGLTGAATFNSTGSFGGQLESYANVLANVGSTSQITIGNDGSGNSKISFVNSVPADYNILFEPYANTLLHSYAISIASGDIPTAFGSDVVGVQIYSVVDGGTGFSVPYYQDEGGNNYAWGTGGGSGSVTEVGTTDYLTVDGTPGASITTSGTLSINPAYLYYDPSNFNAAYGGAGNGASMTGDYNTLGGEGAGDAITTGAYNTFLGHNAGTAAVASQHCVGIGNQCLASTNANFTTAVGSVCGLNTTAQGGCFFGYQTFSTSTSSADTYNSSFGYQSLQYVTGSGNTAFGSNTGNGLSGGCTNGLFLGFLATATTTGLTNCAAIGYNSYVAASNCFSYGNESVYHGFGTTAAASTMHVVANQTTGDSGYLGVLRLNGINDLSNTWPVTDIVTTQNAIITDGVVTDTILIIALPSAYGGSVTNATIYVSGIIGNGGPSSSGVTGQITVNGMYDAVHDTYWINGLSSATPVPITLNLTSSDTTMATASAQVALTGTSGPTTQALIVQVTGINAEFVNWNAYSTYFTTQATSTV